MDYAERVTKVEERLNYVVLQQTDMKEVQKNQNTIIDALANQSAAQAQIAKAIEARTDNHSKEIEKLQADQIETSKAIVSISGQVNRIEIIIKYIGGPILALIISYLFSHFVK